MKPILPTIVNRAAARMLPGRAPGPGGGQRLPEIADFGANPGALRGWAHVPQDLPAASPLVVVLHGCTQTAADYDTGAGWSQLADELGFALLLPEQQRRNNPNLCFNWFSPIDSRRDSGEALSIRQMIAWMAETHGIDAQQVFVTGLSAGGAMASIMLATYPEVFAGGAVIAGLPFGAATSVNEAWSRMAGQGYPTDADLAAQLRAASDHDGPWPRVSVWHGSADTTVSPTNSDRIIAQWQALHGIGTTPAEEVRSGAHVRRSWRNSAGEVVLEQNIITGMGHATPLDPHGPDACGVAGPHMLDVGICSTRQIAQFWGLRQSMAEPGNTATGRSAASVVPQPAVAAPKRAAADHSRKGVSDIIEDALRAAGLMR